MAAELLTDASRATDSNSNPYAGAQWYFYASGTLTPQNVFSNADLSTSLGAVVTADAGGKFVPIYFDASLSYRGVLKSADGATTVYDIDPINTGILNLLSGVDGAASVGTADGGTVQDSIRVITAAMAGIPDDGNEATDVTAQLQALADAAAAKNLAVKLGNRTYRVNATGVEFFTSVSGEAGTIIQSTASTDSAGCVVTMSGPGTVDTLQIDGNVSADPSPWNSTNYDSFTGAQGLIIGAIGSPVIGVTVRNVKVRNVRRAAFKVEIESGGISFENCTADRCRGNFGDGFIAMGARQISYKNCTATDFTRIGFVSDTYGDSPGTYCDQVTYENCRAEDGHDASILYTGGEYNSGFWSEKSGTVSWLNCVVKDCFHRGYVFATGEVVNNQGANEFTAVNCSADNIDTGFLVQALGDVAIKAQLVNCSISTAGTTAYGFAAGTARDNMQMVNCSSVLSGTADVRASVSAGPGTLIIDGFNETWEVVNTTYRDSASLYYGSLSHFANAAGKIVVRDWKTYDNAGAQVASVFKFLAASQASLDLTAERCYLRGVQLLCAKFTTYDVRFQRLGSIGCPVVAIENGSVEEVNQAFEVVVQSTTKQILFKGVRFDLTTSGNAVKFLNLDSVDKFSKIHFDGCTFTKNFETGNYAVLYSMLGGAAGTLAGTTGASNLWATDCNFVNTGGSTANPAFYIDSNTDAGGKLYGRGNMKMATITNAVNGTKLATPASFEDWA